MVRTKNREATAAKPVKVDAKAANIKALTKEITDLNNEIKSLTKEITDLKNQNEHLVQQKGLTEYELSRKEQDVLNLQSQFDSYRDFHDGNGPDLETDLRTILKINKELAQILMVRREDQWKGRLHTLHRREDQWKD